MADAEPAGLGDVGRRLWRSVTGDYVLDEHELILLEQAARVADVCAALNESVATLGLTTEDGRIRPELIELRQERILFARLASALRVPLGDADGDEGKNGPPRLQRRGAPRGVYALHGGAS